MFICIYGICMVFYNIKNVNYIEYNWKILKENFFD